MSNDNRHLAKGFIYQPPLATRLEELREEAREKRRITYDCYNAIARDSRVTCRLGYHLSPRVNNGLPLLSVLRGMSSHVCQACGDFDDDAGKVGRKDRPAKE